jgi:hypothetical protein
MGGRNKLTRLGQNFESLQPVRSLKAACLQIHVDFRKILKMCLKVKYCEMNKETNLHIASSTCNPRKLPKRSKK